MYWYMYSYMYRPLVIVLLALAACHAVPDEGTLPGAPAHVALHRSVYIDDSDYRGALEEAVAFWNRELDAAALVVTTNPEDVDLRIFVGPMGGEEVGDAAPSLGIIRYRQPGDIHQAYIVFCHELGHAAFWLAHDPDHGYSVMAPATAPMEPWASPFDEDPRAPVEHYLGVTHGDRARVRRLLGIN
jgi:hypothetical protein